MRTGAAERVRPRHRRRGDGGTGTRYGRVRTRADGRVRSRVYRGRPALGEHTGTPPRSVGMTDGCRGATPGDVTSGARASVAAEQRAAQSTQRRKQRDPAYPGAPVAALVRGLTRGQLTHQRRRLHGLARREGRPSEYREMTVEARTGRAAPAGDRRDPCPAAHCYLFHVTPHPYESTRPGQGNPIAPVRHACIAVTGFTFPVRGLTITLRIEEIPGRVGQPAARRRGRPRAGPPTGPTVTARHPWEPVGRRKPEAPSGVSRWHSRGARGRAAHGHPGAAGTWAISRG